MYSGPTSKSCCNNRLKQSVSNRLILHCLHLIDLQQHNIIRNGLDQCLSDKTICPFASCSDISVYHDCYLESVQLEGLPQQ